MNMNIKPVTTVSDASKDFQKVARDAEFYGKTVIYENDKPKFLLIDVNSETYFEITDDEKIDVAAKRVMSKFKPAFEELAK